MIQGVSMFSGRNIPKGSGIYEVMSDGRAVLTASNKERRLIARKINPRDIRWTTSSREFFGKESQYVVEKMNVQKVKVVRGFRHISASSLERAKEAGLPKK
ncbi:similarity to 60S RIBOSOMAL PROTEIN L24 [Encephalitozoon cuniculi GB-M1]|uniref:Similarity to 60S RIBOSOMAL PROTEIN L24 n=2 Tax=Encephalitozoon cuniculi TaxID=6035 RepID=Q8SUZ9_ENCCU|nr:60S ribosomal protein L24 [Encephalitozoon cuniculi GB-M1]KMV65817.1 60S ribosomal protein L24 [Encephalitozoon cuniculi EcunIII-L]UYI27252.1 ribosome biogenesis protein RLP24 [Encephalitozoon cuniculi]7QEP_N4 Chain N4, Similarity to 60S RIBOSOMAL PROTEIN L24 [Encephalitozoon cuniculi GB-M1]CAD25625.2 similarity to 60S RIBOSOMAL PROTEIN L24 [Encephalitozoon cuniculi GB-M1]